MLDCTISQLIDGLLALGTTPNPQGLTCSGDVTRGTRLWRRVFTTECTRLKFGGASIHIFSTCSGQRDGEHLVQMSTAPRQPLTLTILYLYFDEVVPLERYLHEILALSSRSSDSPNSGIPPMLVGDDPQSYRDLLKTSYVALKSDASQRPSFAVTPPLMYMRDVSSRAYIIL